ncbi:MAG: hypothetical protein QME93_02135 [Bacillota bacterium]|nr:hypothetical protein [Bacillota bacterium]MDI7248852.1 hypothetical protein [Bacillota bacterium]
MEWTRELRLPLLALPAHGAPVDIAPLVPFAHIAFQHRPRLIASRDPVFGIRPANIALEYWPRPIVKTDTVQSVFFACILPGNARSTVEIRDAAPAVPLAHVTLECRSRQVSYLDTVQSVSLANVLPRDTRRTIKIGDTNGPIPPAHIRLKRRPRPVTYFNAVQPVPNELTFRNSATRGSPQDKAATAPLDPFTPHSAGKAAATEIHFTCLHMHNIRPL